MCSALAQGYDSEAGFDARDESVCEATHLPGVGHICHDWDGDVQGQSWAWFLVADLIQTDHTSKRHLAILDPHTTFLGVVKSSNVTGSF